jgi:hypothetical protein
VGGHQFDMTVLFTKPDQGFVWPPRNGDEGQDKGVEQDFFRWMGYVVEVGPVEWAYLPIFWNRYYINNGWGSKGLEELQQEINDCRKWRKGEKWFTVCEYDLRTIQPFFDLHDLVVFTASRRKESSDIDIPLLSAPHPVVESNPNKEWLACFLGHMQTDGSRIKMGEALADRKDCRIEHANYGPNMFRDVMMHSYIALAPRGQGAQSFRFYEAMQLGVVPLYISDLDCRPFKQWIDWDSCSLYLPSTENLNEFLDSLSPRKLLEMGRKAKQVYDEQLAYGMWCPYVLKTLETL